MKTFTTFWTISVLQPSPSMQRDCITMFSTKETAIEAGEIAFEKFGRIVSVFPGKFADGISGPRVWKSLREA